MSQKMIYESDAKRIIGKFLNSNSFVSSEYAVITSLEDMDTLVDCHQWLLNSNLVVKPDQCVKRRGIYGLVGLNLQWEQVKQWVRDRFNKTVQLGDVSGVLKRFIVEPFIKHEKEDETYFCIYSKTGEDVLMYSSLGGIDVGDIRQHARSFSVPIGSELELDKLRTSGFLSNSNTDTDYIYSFIIDLYVIFKDLHFTYLELNPLVLSQTYKKIYIVDVAAKIDSCADFLCAQNWEIESFPPVFGRDMLDEEKYIAKLDAKSGASLKLVILNKNGKIWTMVAGGGASVVYSDTICDLNFSSELANYGEYSGAPTEGETFEYSKTILNLMLSTPPRPDGKILIIGGGIANFTNVASTFKGIIRSLELLKDKIIQHKIKIFVRRGGPNYQEGLANLRDIGIKLNIPIYVFGVDIHMTAIVSMALGKTPLSQSMIYEPPSTSSLTPVSITPAPTYENGHDPNIFSNVHKIASSHLSNDLFNEDTTAIIWGFQLNAVQGMLDFDFLCRRQLPSIVAMVYPYKASSISTFYFGSKEIIIPIFGSLKEATTKFPSASVLINFSSHRASFEINMEALQYPQFKLISIFAEGIPERFTQIFNKAAKEANVMVLGPSCIGGLKPGSFRIGFSGGMIDNLLSSRLYSPGSVAFVTRSGGMANELNNIISRNTDGVFEGIHIGGDRYPGSSFIDHLTRFNSCPEVELLVMLGEVGGLEEYKICEALKSKKITKPLIAWCIGTCSSYFKTTIQFGHANACAGEDNETAMAKNKALKEAGAIVPDSFDTFDVAIRTTYQNLLSAGLWKRKNAVNPPSVPVDYKWAKELGLVRKPTSFMSSICDERGNEPVYFGYTVSQIFDEGIGIGGTVGLLWFQRKLPPHIIKFIEMCIIIVADHGPAVCGAHNTIVTARAGKDLMSALCSGLLTIGDRFGGAIDGAAKMFWNAYSSRKTPSQFVTETRNKGELIMGIGHLVKTISNPDTRITQIIKYVRDSIPSTPVLNYALEVEKITTSKKANLILNIDGTIATSFIDLMLQSKCFTEQEVVDYIRIGAFNALFVLGRSIGFIGHYLDQNRLKQGLYRHPWDDICFVDTPPPN